MAEARPRHVLEALGARMFFRIFGWLPIDAASALGGWLARAIGPHLGATKRAELNLQRAMPGLGKAEIGRIVAGMWDNLGRVVAEYPHLHEIEVFKPGGRVEVVGAEEIIASRGRGKRYILFSAHYGNWEVAALAAAQAGLAVAQIYRAPNNPLIDRLIMAARGRDGGLFIPKGHSAARRLVEAIANGHALTMLVDQKMNDGIAVPFFGRDAMTAPALGRLARRFDCTIVPVRVERRGGAHFRLICEPPLPVPRSADPHADVLALMTAVNATIERWIRADPAQWFWLHRRWPE